MIKQVKDWKVFRSAVKVTKYSFFDDKIQEIASSKCRPWELMNWVKKHKLPANEAI